ncbi:hypothetical protein PRZ48_012614 [Zasmidium cellare]|uniref:Uncharacterized protein n=1 Tax=Zasmidium cellare TaxID=395010 RepID=A0ABR0E5N0_ZASCE|nr:hypothetical protein PRZ48_012614 [Zasmidium cellare]
MVQERTRLPFIYQSRIRWRLRGHQCRDFEYRHLSAAWPGPGMLEEKLDNGRTDQEQQWYQLPLCPNSIRHSSTTAGGASVIVHLDRRNERPPKRKLHKLEDGVPHHDREPPPGIEIINLNSVHLSMRFSRTSTRKRRKLEKSLSGYTATHEDLTTKTPLLESNSEQASRQDELKTCGFDPKSSHVTAGATCRRSKTSPVPHTTTSDDDDMLFEADSPSPKPTEAGLNMDSVLRKRSYSTGDLRQGEETFDTNEDLLDLFDAGLRLAITTHSGRLPKDVRIASNESFKHLADVFPAVWSPGYMSAVSSRAVFLPTVSHALAKICGEHAQCSTLRSKFAELQRQRGLSNRGHEGDMPPDEAASPLSRQASVAMRLWETMQRSLFEKDTTYRLKPISVPSEDLIDNEIIWPDSPGIASHPAENEDIDDFVSDSDESMLDEGPLAPEPRADQTTSLPWNEHLEFGSSVHGDVKEHATGEERGFHVDVAQDDEVLSLCDSVGSIVLDDGLDVASSQGPGERRLPSDDLEEDLFASSSDAEMEMDEMMPI